MGVGNKEVTFFVNVYRDFALAQDSLFRVRTHFPESRVIVVSDGDPDPRYAALAAALGLEYHQGERLIPVQKGGAIVQRMLGLFLLKPSASLIKIDTDTRVHRRLRWLPDGVCVFGSLEHQTSGDVESLSPPNVQGGCIGITLGAAHILHESGIFSSPRLCDALSTWASCRDMVARVKGAGLVSDDFLMRYGCAELGIPMRSYSEVDSRWRNPVHNETLQYAITHPHKLCLLCQHSVIP